MQVIPTKLPEVLLIEPKVFGDGRGYFLEAWNQQRYAALGLVPFVQDNLSSSCRGTLRGLHYQNPQSQGKLVTVYLGEVYDVAVDIRRGSSTFGQWVGVLLSGGNGRQLYVPPGFAHGFCVLSDWADLHYKVSRRYDPADSGGLRWNDPDVGIRWPIEAPRLTARDAAYPLLRELAPAGLPHHPPAE